MPTWQSRNFLIGMRLLRDQVRSFAEYPFNIPAIGGLDELTFEQPATFFIGENGSGKSTLLEAIAVSFGLNPEGGSRNFNFATRASHSDLNKYLRLVRSPRRVRDRYFLRAESYFNVATEIETLDREPFGGSKIINSYGGRSLHEQSHGESFLDIAVNRLGPRGFYLFDEPEAALSVRGQLALIRRMHELVLERSQFVVATHSPILLGYPEATILELSEDGIRSVGYEETEQVELTRSFLENPGRFLRHLLADD